ncbi:MAG: TrkA family potassium uptake protein [Fimbriimonadaceae bacterium]|nr:TrkA family potassium uptake protein [Fimbriimonadaceae bacterium]
MKIIVVGCGRVGAALAQRLFEDGHEVTVVDQTSEAFRGLSANFRGRTLTGDILSEDVLGRTDMANAEAVAVVTNSDTLNAVLAHVAKTVYNVPNVVVRNFDPRRRPLHEAFGLQVISSTSWGVERVQELLVHPGLQSLFAVGHGETRVYEVAIGAAQAGRSVADLLPAGEALPVALNRGGRALLPRPDERLQTGDILLVSATAAGAKPLAALFTKDEEA